MYIYLQFAFVENFHSFFLFQFHWNIKHISTLRTNFQENISKVATQENAYHILYIILIVNIFPEKGHI